MRGIKGYLLSFINYKFIKEYSLGILDIDCGKYRNIYLYLYLRSKNLDKVLYIALYWGIELFLPVILVSQILYLFFKNFLCLFLFGKKNNIYTSRIFVHSHRIETAVEKNIFMESDILLNYPYSFNEVGRKGTIIEIYNILTIKILFRTLFDSIYVNILMFVRFGYNSLFFGLSAFHWFLLFNSLNSIDPSVEIVMCNQKDRWAILLDMLNTKKKTIVQHGTNILKYLPNNKIKSYYVYDENTKLYYMNMPYKLKNISHLYAFNELEAKYILLGEQKSHPTIEYIGYRLKLSDVQCTGKSILIIGEYTNYSDIETRLIEYFDNTIYKIFLKSHPLVDPIVYEDLLSRYNFTLLTGKIYPRVDIVFSYNSTLALEYESFNIPVVYYDYIFDDNNEINDDKIKKTMSNVSI